MIRNSLGNTNSFPTVTNRHSLTTLAAAEGVRVPESAALTSLAALSTWATAHSPRWVIKADGTWAGQSVRIVDSLEDAERAFCELSTPSGFLRSVKWMIVDREAHWLRSWWNRDPLSLSVQAFVDGRPANCAVVCANGRVLAGIAVEVTRWRGQTGPATEVRVVEGREMLRAAEIIADRLGLSGFFGLDFILEHATGRPYLIEMNPRCTPLSHLSMGPGRDLCAALAAHLSQSPVRERLAASSEGVIQYFPPAGPEEESTGEPASRPYLDIPIDEPDLVKALLNPWPRRTVVSRLYRAMRTSWISKVTLPFD